MRGPVQRLAEGLAAGCAGTVALNVASYVDQYVKARPPSQTPARLAEVMADRYAFDLGEGEARANRASALGPLLGYANGLSLGILWAFVSAHPGRSLLKGSLLLTAAAWAGSALPLKAFGVSDPADWTKDEWTSDLVPHAAYGVTAALVTALLRR
jgi:hypothetical protein